MKNRCIRLLFQFVIFCIAGRVALAAANPIEIDRFVDSLTTTNSAMMGVTISQKGQVLYERYSGYRSVEQNLPLNRDTQFRIGSITKMYTAVMIMKLIEDGKLSLATPLSEFFPQIPNAQLIHIKHLLNHSSGIFNFTNDPLYTSYMTEKQSRKEMIEWIASYEPLFPPGEFHAYSNSNYVLLGQIIERIEKRCYASALRKTIAKPLDLSRTQYGKKPKPRKNQALSYSYATVLDQWRPASVTHLSIPHGAGAVISTPMELTRFLEALATGELISQESVAQMVATEGGFGLGIFPREFDGEHGFGHTGGIDAFRSAAFYFPEYELSIAVVTNGIDYPFDKLLTGIVNLHFQLPFDYSELHDEPVELNAQTLSRYEGTFGYENDPQDAFILLAQDKHLHIQFPGQPPIALEAFSGNTFRLKLYDLSLHFTVDETGTLDYDEFQLAQGGQQSRFVRLE